jgi:hypothetical protein
VPLELAGLGVEGENAVGIEIVAGAVAIVAVGPRISCGPVKGVGRWIVRTGEPSGTAERGVGTVQRRQTSAPLSGLKAATKPRIP